MKKTIQNISKYRLLWVWTFLSLISCHSKEVQKEKVKKPNVLFIIVDDLKPMLGCYGDSLIKTPHIDKLASHGMVLTNNHCQQAVCAPSRASLFTGRRPDFTKVYDLKTQIRDKHPEVVTLPQYFKENGYTTAAVGKIYDTRSVDSCHDSLSWSLPYDLLEGSNPIGEGWIYSKERISTEAPEVEDSVMLDGKISQHGVALLRQLSKRSSPFFLAVGFHKPHLPFVAPKKYWDLYDRDDFKVARYQKKAKDAPGFAYQPGWELRSLYVDIPKKGTIEEEKQLELIHGYHACVSFVDYQIGLLLEELANLGLDENTIVVLCGDHGWHLGDHNMWCKHTNYEQATRSPLILSYGSRYIGKNDSPTEFVDLYPTLCDIGGLGISDSLEGKSLLPILSSDRSSIKDYAVSQYHRNGNMMGYAFRDKRYRYVVWMKSEFKKDKLLPYNDSLVVAKEMYDYQKDPLETKNIIDQKEYQSILRLMEARCHHFFEHY